MKQRRVSKEELEEWKGLVERKIAGEAIDLGEPVVAPYLNGGSRWDLLDSGLVYVEREWRQGLRSMLTSFHLADPADGWKETETTLRRTVLNTSRPVCPYCGRRISEWGFEGFNGPGAESECPSCGEEFFARVELTESWTTRLIVGGE